MQSHYLAATCDKAMLRVPPFSRSSDDSYTRQVYYCWKYQLAPDEIHQLLRILGQANFTPQVARQFHARFNQLAIARMVTESTLHLSSRISRNGWAFGPSFAFLEWLAQTPISQVGAVPRFAVLRWTLDKMLTSGYRYEGKLVAPPHACGVAETQGTFLRDLHEVRCALLV